jgi:hypothetical protein
VQDDQRGLVGNFSLPKNLRNADGSITFSPFTSRVAKPFNILWDSALKEIGAENQDTEARPCGSRLPQNNLRDRFQRNEIDIIPSAQILPPVLVMTRSVDADKNRAARAIGRREFMLAAVATSGMASSYLRGQLSSLRAGTALSPGFDAASSSETVKGVVTPNIDFFIRNHFRTPTISEEKWNLEISGMVAKPLKLSYSDLLLTSSVRRPLTLECAENLSGWGGVSTAVWSGLPLEVLLKQAGVQAGATTVVFHGADSGEGEGVPPGIHFARAIPLEKAMDPSTPCHRLPPTRASNKTCLHDGLKTATLGALEDRLHRGLDDAASGRLLQIIDRPPRPDRRQTMFRLERSLSARNQSRSRTPGREQNPRRVWHILAPAPGLAASRAACFRDPARKP